MIGFRSIGILLLVLIGLSSCWPSNISFRENSMPEEWKTFYVLPLEVSSATAPAVYSGLVTEAVRSGLQNNTRLKMTTQAQGADVLISGEVTGYYTSPVAVQANDNASLNRLNITVRYLIQTKTKGLEQQEFTTTRFADYSSSQNLLDVESELLTSINQLLVQDVINKLLSNW